MLSRLRSTLSAPDACPGKIFAADGGYFEAEATVIYSNPSLGMEVVFRQVQPDLLAVLRKWLLKAMQQIQADEENLSEEKPTEEK